MEEQQFQLNLQELCKLNTIEVMFNVLLYIQSNNIEEGRFIEKEYVRLFFDNKMNENENEDKFEYLNVSYLHQQWNDAIREHNTELLKLFGNAHRRCQLFFAKEETRKKIQHLIQERERREKPFLIKHKI
jgi:hypothetical protein